jgi:hypothetical protein
LATKSGSRYLPERGDVVWLSFESQAGHEQAGRRLALILGGWGARAQLRVFQYRQESPFPVIGHGHPHTPPCPEQQPRLFAQLKQVGERVPSQQRRPVFGGGSVVGAAFTRIVSVLETLPHAPPDAVRVTVSRPVRLAA